jgi:hypothetical protein
MYMLHVHVCSGVEPCGTHLELHRSQTHMSHTVGMDLPEYTFRGGWRRPRRADRE